MKLLEDYLEKLNICYDDNILQKFEKYYELLIFYNNKFNLTNITEKNDVIIKHFADSLYGYSFFKETNCVADVGAGAGFPSIPLAIVLPDVNFTLIDSLNKRVNFLNVVKEELNLKAKLRLKYVAEMFLKIPNGKYHEIGFYYLTSINESEIPNNFKSIDSNGTFEWIPISNLNDYNILARPIKKIIINKEITNDDMERIVYREY